MKKVESIWAELSAKTQEVAQESTELSEEKVELRAAYTEYERHEREFNQLMSEYEQTLKKYDKISNTIRELKQEFGFISDSVNKQLAKVDADEREWMNALKEIGADPTIARGHLKNARDIAKKVQTKAERMLQRIGRA